MSNQNKQETGFALCKKQLVNGLFKENPTLVLMLGMCPTMAVTTQAIYGFGMGISTTVVLILSNMMISALRNIIPDKVRIPAFIGIIASFVTIVQMLLEAFVPSLYDALGLYIPLIVVNCIILGRAESFASKNKVIPSMFDGIGMGLGFTLALTLIGLIREILGAGTIFSYEFSTLAAMAFGENSGFARFLAGFTPISIFVLAPGAFFVLAVLTAIQNRAKIKGEAKGKNMDQVQSGCTHDCMSCGDSACEHKFFDEKGVDGPVGKKEEIKAKEAQAKEEAKAEAVAEVEKVEVEEVAEVEAVAQAKEAQVEEEAEVEEKVEAKEEAQVEEAEAEETQKEEDEE